MSRPLLYIDNPICVELGAVASCANPETPVTDATVEVTITDLDGVEVDGETWPLSMPWVSADTVYRGITDPSVVLVENTYYYVLVVAKNADEDVIGTWKPRLRAERRETA